MGDEEKDRQEQRLVEDRIDERPGAQPASGVEDFEQHHDFGEHEGVDEGKALHGEIDPVLAQGDALVENENSEQNPQIEEEHEEPAELVGRLGFQGPRAMGVRAGRGGPARACRILRHRITSQLTMGRIRGRRKLLREHRRAAATPEFEAWRRASPELTGAERRLPALRPPSTIKATILLSEA